MADQPQGQPQQPDHLDALAEVMAKLDPAVVQHILGTLNAPSPVAPTPPAFTGLSPLKAAAAAMNPQFAPTLINQQMAPEQARFQQQQAAFEQAMQGKREALTAGASIYNTGQKAMAPGQTRPLRYTNRFSPPTPGPDGKMYVNEERVNPYTGQSEVISVREVPVGVTYAYDENNRLIQVPTKVAGYGGGPKEVGTGKSPTPAELGQKTSQFELLRQIDEFGSKADKYEKTSPQNFASAVVQETVRGLGKPGQALSEGYGDPQLEELASYKNKLTKTIATMRETGRLSDQDVAWAEQELSTIAALKSKQGAAVVKTKLANLKNELTNRMRIMAQSRPFNFTPQERQELGVAAVGNPTPPPMLSAPDPAVDTFREIFGRDPGGQ
jgi:hypothetical protein